MIVNREGNLLDSNLQAIAHQVNCMGIMGAGIAKQIKQKWPKVCEDYQNYLRCLSSRKLALGTICTTCLDGTHYVANLFSQFAYGAFAAPFPDGRHTDYDALRNALIQLKEIGFTEIGIPYNLGCGLARGDWDGVVYPMLNELFGNDDTVTLYIYKLKNAER